MPTSWKVGPDPTEVLLHDDWSIKRQIWSLPLEPYCLQALISELFTEHWRGIRFGPIIEGAAYELRCPSAPSSIDLHDGYLTIRFSDASHFHICISDNHGDDSYQVSQVLREHRKPSKAQIFRAFGQDGKPMSWGFEMWNGAGEPMISILFPNPFIADTGGIEAKPDFSRLKTWRAIAKKWLNREPEHLDEEGLGFHV